MLEHDIWGEIKLYSQSTVIHIWLQNSVFALTSIQSSEIASIKIRVVPQGHVKNQGKGHTDGAGMQAHMLSPCPCQHSLAFWDFSPQEKVQLLHVGEKDELTTLGLVSQTIVTYLASTRPVRDTVSKNSMRSDWGRHLTLSFGLYTHLHTCATVYLCTHIQTVHTYIYTQI